MTFPELGYIVWAKTLPQVRVNLARSGLEPCPPALLKLRASDLVANLPVQYGYAPLLARIAKRYGVSSDRVFTVSGGTTMANWVAAAAALNGCPRTTEVIVERPTYEPLLRLPEALGYTVRRFERRNEDGYGIDLDRFASLITPRTRLAIVSNLHNPSGARIDPVTLRRMASLMASVGGYLLVDEVYLESVFTARRAASCVHAGTNVLATNSLTKAYGLDGLRAGWVLGPRELIARAGRIFDLIGGNGVAPGEQMTLAAFHRLDAIARRAQSILSPNRRMVREFLRREPRLKGRLPDGGGILLARLPAGLNDQTFSDHLRDRYSTLVVPGSFFEAPGYVRISFGCAGDRLAMGLASISRALDDLTRASRRG